MLRVRSGQALAVHGAEHVTWYATSERVRRGSCSTCGAQLLWDPLERDWIAVAMGAFETPTGTRLAKHIHVASRGDYYDLADGLPQHEHRPGARPRAGPPPRSTAEARPRGGHARLTGS